MISVIIPTIGRPELQRAIESVKAQTYKDYELIVADDRQRRGKSVTMNEAVKRAKGEYIVFLDDDNVFYPGFLEMCMNYINDFDAVTTSRDVEGLREPARIKITPFTAIDWGWVMRKDQYIGYDEELQGDEDADYGIRFLPGKRVKVIWVPYQYAYDTTSPDSITWPSERRLKGLERFMEKHLEKYKQYPNELRYLYRLAGRNYYKAGQRKKGLYYFWLSFKAKPNFRTFLHLFFLLYGWRAYDWYMSTYE